MMDVDFQYELYNEWVESKEKITFAEFCYKKGRKDAIEDFKKYLLRHKHLVSEFETKYKYEAVKIEFITDTDDLFLSEHMKEGA